MGRTEIERENVTAAENMRTLIVALVVLGITSATSQFRPSDADMKRALQPRPTTSSHVHGATPSQAFEGMNKVLEADAVKTMPCESFTHEELNEVAKIIYAMRAPELDHGYRARSDRRALHFDNISHKELLWHGETIAADNVAWHAPGTDKYNATRDGKCAEIVMWFYHHLAEGHRAELAMVSAFAVPMMPTDVAPKEARSAEYDQQIGCTSCHSPVQFPGAPPITPIVRKNSSAPQYPMTCPVDSKTGKAKVWYEPVQGTAGLGKRIKRCDWDYTPFCQPCEGVGGMTWGNGEHEWNPMPCSKVADPEDIPKDNLTSPLWPKDFGVEEYAHLTFPGRDPCEVNFRNSTYSLRFNTNADGPVYHTIGHSGPSGPSPLPGSSYGYPNSNFYTISSILGKGVFCVCLGGPGDLDPTRKNALVGPLTYDFNKGAKLIGRERIKPEHMDEFLVTDHWVKGPHHFWIRVDNNQMLREWQPFNGLQTYYNWNFTRPEVKLDSMCYKGLLHANISCSFPTPNLTVGPAPGYTGY